MVALGLYEGPAVYSGLALALIAVLVVNAFNSIRTRATVQRVLHLRKLLPSSASLSLKEHINPFVDELMLVFKMTGLIIDTATPKFVGASVPLLTAQEHSHHSWHATAYKGREHGLWRWSWLDAFGRLVLLQSGPLSLASIGGVEAGTLPFFFLPVFLPFVRSSISSLFVFHGLEEIEHGALTGQCLTDKSYLFWRIVAWLGNIGFLCIHLLLPPVVRILWQPAVLLRPRCYGDLVLYYLVMFPTMVATVWWMLWHFVLGLPESQRAYSFAMDFMHKLAHERGIRFEVVKTGTYALKM